MEEKTLESCRNTWTDEYGVMYSKDKKVLLFFPNYFNHSIYVVNENCVRISEDAFPRRFLINGYSGEEFLARNEQHIRIERYGDGNLKWFGHNIDEENDNSGFFCDEAEAFLKDHMSNPYAELRDAIKNLSYHEIVAKDPKGKLIVAKCFWKKQRNYNYIRKLIFPNPSIKIPKSVFSIIENIDELVFLSDKGEPDKEIHLSKYPEIKSITRKGFNSPEFSGDPTIDVINVEEIVNWNKFKDEYDLRNNRYVEDIRTFIRVQADNKESFPVVFFPNSLKKAASKKFSWYKGRYDKDKDEFFTYGEILTIARTLQLKGHTWRRVEHPVNPFHPYKEYIYKKTMEEFSKCGKWKRIYRKFTKAAEKEAQKRYIQELENAYDYSSKEYFTKKDYIKRKKEHSLFLDTYADKIASYVWRHSIEGTGGLPYEENPRMGHYEKTLYAALYAKFPEYLKINRKKGIYYPDFIIDIDGHYFIDVEIDEPYAMNKEAMVPIHYTGADDVRDGYFKEQNWFVLRFAEQQIKEDIKECVYIINCVVKFIKSGNTENLEPIIHTRKKIAVPRWTRDDAMAMDVVGTRQNGYDLPVDEALRNIWREICNADKSK